MNTEVELKYQLLGSRDDRSSAVANITNLLKAQHCSFEMHQHQLINDYFDNDNLDLRKMDCGLRIRTKTILNNELNLNKKNTFADQCFEQTIKTAGKVDGGLHKRPEYNVDIQKNKLDLSLFPISIWPVNTQIEQLQQSLFVIFSTNFLRQTWLIHQDENIIELALDNGEIFTALSAQKGEKKIFINEIEIELVRGDEQALFALAKQLMTIISMEPSNVSKAARGYSLFYDQRRGETPS